MAHVSGVDLRCGLPSRASRRHIHGMSDEAGSNYSRAVRGNRQKTDSDSCGCVADHLERNSTQAVYRYDDQSNFDQLRAAAVEDSDVVH
jgi:hypothetical protein